MASPGVPIRVIGPTEQVRQMSRRLKGSPPEVGRELYRVVGGALKVVADETKREQERVSWDLPGHLTGHNLGKITQKARTSGFKAGGEVGQLRPSPGGSTGYTLNRDGTVRHPLFGNRAYWFNTSISGTQGWFTEASRRATPGAIKELNDRMTEFVKKILDTGISYKG